MQNLILKLFGRAFKTARTLSFKEANGRVASKGYILHPDVCDNAVIRWIENNHRNLNATFYKKWDDIISKNRLELFYDQIQHYASTYGTNNEGKPYIPNEGAETPDLTQFKLILPITEEEVIERCNKMLYSGIALSDETLKDVLSILDGLNVYIDIDKVKNKEAKMQLCKDRDRTPKDPVEMVRFLVYMMTGRTLLIKDKVTIAELKTSQKDTSALFYKHGLASLATVFYRFKPLFLAMKNKHNRFIINKLRRLAVKNHKPMKIGFFESLLANAGDTETLDELAVRLKEINNFKKVRLLEALHKKMKSLDYQAYIIRNGKLWIEETTKKNVTEAFKLYEEMHTLIYSNLVDTLKQKACTISLPKGLHITAPTSGKSFIGAYPIGTAFDFADKDAIFGIHWRGDEGLRDLDLSLWTIEGHKLGWNSSYYNKDKSLVFSGDMTSANPEAVELFYAKNGFGPAIAKVNNFSGEKNCTFQFFIAKEKVTDMKRNYMVNPNNVIFNVDCKSEEREQTLGVITNNQFVLAQLKTGRGSVSGDSVTNKYTDYMLQTLDCYVSLNQLLVDAGFTITDNKPQIDLSVPSKDSFISLLAD